MVILIPAAIIASAVYLRRTAIPVVVAYQAGRQAERLMDYATGHAVTAFRVGLRIGARTARINWQLPR